MRVAGCRLVKMEGAEEQIGNRQKVQLQIMQTEERQQAKASPRIKVQVKGEYFHFERSTIPSQKI